MKQRTLSFSTILGFLGLTLLVSTFNARAGIVCQTAFGEKKFVIEDKHVSFVKEDYQGVQRSISSLSNIQVRTQKKHLGFAKTLYVDGNRHRISVRDVNAFSDVNDYLSITSPKGHEMTYPIQCQST